MTLFFVVIGDDDDDDDGDVLIGCNYVVIIVRTPQTAPAGRNF